MRVTSTIAAQELGISDRQVRRLASTGVLSAERKGNDYSFSLKTITAYKRGGTFGRRWKEQTQLAAAELLSGITGFSHGLPDTSRSRLKGNIKKLSTEHLAGRLLSGRSKLIEITTSLKKDYSPQIIDQLSLTRGGIGFALTIDLPVNHYVDNDEGTVALVDVPKELRNIFELAVLIIYGSARDREAAQYKMHELQRTLSER